MLTFPSFVEGVNFELFYKCFKFNLNFYNIKDILVFVKFDSSDTNRRHGYKYFLSIYKLFNLMYRDGFISLFHFFKIVSINFLLRCLPIFVLKIVYNFLRSRSWFILLTKFSQFYIGFTFENLLSLALMLFFELQNIDFLSQIYLKSRA